MKKTLMFLVLASLLAFSVAGCGDSKQEPSGGSSIKQEISDTVDYGIGVTQTRALKKAQQQVQQLNEQHNKELEDALK